MLTIDVMPFEKIEQKARETMSIYAPIAHRMGISTIKNILEDLCFRYLFPDAFNNINDFLISNKDSFKATLQLLIKDITLKMHQGSFIKSDFKIEYRIKHKYSIHLKKQRKHIQNNEIFDILAIRILVNTKDDCYKVLGIIHQNYHPIMTRFKDYIAIPKENGYETIQTTILNEIATCEVQIRTFDMHKTAEFGIASHWQYKEISSKKPELSWMESLSLTSDMHEFDELIQDKLKIDTIDVYSPRHEQYSIQRYATALDFAYKIHEDIGKYAKYAYINGKKASLITVLENNDMVNIITDDSKIHINCLWADIVTTKKARDIIRSYCKSYIKEIDEKYVFSLLVAIFQKEDVKKLKEISKEIDKNDLLNASSDIKALKKVVEYTNNKLRETKGNISKFIHHDIKLDKKRLDNFLIYSNRKIKKVEYDFCCHPKKRDNIVAFLDKNNIYIHNKMCNMAIKMIENHKSGIFILWYLEQMNQFRLIVALQDKVGVLAEFITHLSKSGISITSVELGNKDSIHLESNNVQIVIDTKLNIEYVKGTILKKFNVIGMCQI
jgi:RelA/SpoT family (p)ppGpp synthetase